MAPTQTSIKEPLTSIVPNSNQLAEIHSQPHHFKKFIGHAAFGVALLATCLQAGAASALSFNFTFTGSGPNSGSPTQGVTVTGIVDGLVDNLSGQTSGLTVTITSATNTPPGGWPSYTDSDYANGTGFDVAGGFVTGALIYYTSSSPSTTLYLTSEVGNHDGSFLATGDFSIYNQLFNTSPTNTLIFTPYTAAPVPAPLPLFGAVAAFGWSRRLRRRIQTPA